MMGNLRLYKIECFHKLGTSESERLKVTALNLFHPTASPPLYKSHLFLIATQPQQREGVRGPFSLMKLQESPGIAFIDRPSLLGGNIEAIDYFDGPPDIGRAFFGVEGGV